MSIKTRAAMRLATHLSFMIGVMVLVYVVFLALPLDVFLMILGGAGFVFFMVQMFRIYVSIEEMAENRKK